MNHPAISVGAEKKTPPNWLLWTTLCVSVIVIILSIVGIVYCSQQKCPPEKPPPEKPPPDGNGKECGKECGSGHTCIPNSTSCCGSEEICYNPDDIGGEPDFVPIWTNDKRWNTSGDGINPLKISQQDLEDHAEAAGLSLRDACFDYGQRTAFENEKVCGVNFFRCSFPGVFQVDPCNGEGRTDNPCRIYFDDQCDSPEDHLKNPADSNETFVGTYKKE